MMSSRRVHLLAIALLAIVILIATLLPATAFGSQPAPKVLSVSPADNATNVPIAQTFTITFDSDMNPATITTGNIFLYPDTGTALAATITYNSEAKTATLVPSAKLVAAKTYYLRLTINVKSTAGVSVEGAPLTWTYRTVANTPPRVVSKSPADGAVNVPLNQVISIGFDSPMDPAKFTQFTFYVAKRGGPVLPGTVAYDAATKTATLTPAQDLDEAATYDVTVLGPTGMNGMFIYGAPIMWSFSTVLVQPPSVITKSPAPGAADQPLDVVVTAAFDRPMDAATITTGSFYLQKQGGAHIDCTMSANEHGTTLTPNSKLEPGTTYQVTLTSDIKSAKGATLIGAPVTWSFTTKDVESPFSDVSKSSRYFTAIYELSQRGMIGGFSDGTFHPAATVTREQFAKLLVKALKLTVTGTEVSPFGDVVEHEGSDPNYPARYIAVCAAHGIIQGKTAKLFAPYENVSRYQAITMAVRGIDSINRGLLKEPGASYKATWNTSLNATHGENARLAEFNGLLANLPLNELNPQDPMTRGEIAQLLWNVVQLLEK